jgi:putative FmdB family regulatory protein
MLVIWDHECGKCGTVTEELVNADERTISCPACGGVAERIMTSNGDEHHKHPGIIDSDPTWLKEPWHPKGGYVNLIPWTDRVDRQG